MLCTRFLVCTPLGLLRAQPGPAGVILVAPLWSWISQCPSPAWFFCWVRIPFPCSSSPCPSLSTPRPELGHLPLQHCCPHPPAPHSVTGSVRTCHPNALVTSAPQNLHGTVSLCPWTTGDSCGLGRVCPRGAGCSGIKTRAWLHFPSPHCASSSSWGHWEEKVPPWPQWGTQLEPLSHVGQPHRGAYPSSHTRPVESAS